MVIPAKITEDIGELTPTMCPKTIQEHTPETFQ